MVRAERQLRLPPKMPSSASRFVITLYRSNYISATLAIYLDLYNVFTNLLALLGIFGGNRN